MSNTSMYGMIKPIDAMGAIEGGMKMRDLIDERKKKSAVQDAYKQGIKVGPDGKVIMDHNLTASALAQGGYGQEAYEAQQQGQTEQQKQMERHVKNAQYGAQLYGAARNQEEWDLAEQKVAALGIPTENIPREYSPENQKFLVDSAMTLSDRLNEQFRQKTFESDNNWKKKSHDLDREKFGFTKESTSRELDIKDKEATAKKAGEVGKLATDLRKERSDLPTTKDTQKVSAAYNRIQSAAKDPSAAGDMALIFNYMKMLDPGSTVREGEFLTAQQAAGLPTRIVNEYHRLVKGERLAPEQRKDFLGKAAGQYQAQLDLQNQADQTFVTLAERSGIDPKDVIVDFQATKPAPEKPPPLTPDQLVGMSREQKIAEAQKRGLLAAPQKQVAGGMRRSPGGGG
jgi:hypothetical protein